jgi:hypothetical protein
VGATSLSQFLESVRPLTFEPAQISCPMLCLVSRGEGHGFLEQANEVYDALTVPKHFYIFSIEEGADAHCQLNNFSRMQQVVYDWLDDVFAAE